jgi:hypothetical protein
MPTLKTLYVAYYVHPYIQRWRCMYIVANPKVVGSAPGDGRGDGRER